MAMEPLQLADSTLGRGAQWSDHRPKESRETNAAAPARAQHSQTNTARMQAEGKPAQDTPRTRSTRVKAWGPAPVKPGERTPPAGAGAAEYASSAGKSHTTRAGWQSKAGWKQGSKPPEEPQGYGWRAKGLELSAGHHQEGHARAGLGPLAQHQTPEGPRSLPRPCPQNNPHQPAS